MTINVFDIFLKANVLVIVEQLQFFVYDRIKRKRELLTGQIVFVFFFIKFQLFFSCLSLFLIFFILLSLFLIFFILRHLGIKKSIFDEVRFEVGDEVERKQTVLLQLEQGTEPRPSIAFPLSLSFFYFLNVISVRVCIFNVKQWLLIFVFRALN